ncbi:hypothetical protein AS4_41530 [Acinetobacter guillouiae]|uniref:hypothetical protein n=1 Tax=Acinetobacter guillouiae TaxID=106649 RepID=UPI0004EF65F7|nr:hypothetical protein [Acinetobacter guillouiae]BAP39093.1 hypothetical protein AS4_41530 [Acinetobacter guillouiae]
MIEDYFKPLTLQKDSGLGSTADSFYYAAKALEENQESKYGFGIGGGKLPILYLYRHSVELYLKSVITLIYRICAPSEEMLKSDDNLPMLIEKGKEKKIFNIHSINTLFENYLRLLEENKKFINLKCKTNWFDISDEFPKLIKLVEDFDKNSTMFRYPITMSPNLDYKKSTFKKLASTDNLNKSIESLTKPKIFLLVENQDNEIVESYVSDEDVLNDVHGALKELSDHFMGLHFGLKYELTK